jgi:hypothetical protein
MAKIDIAMLTTPCPASRRASYFKSSTPHRGWRCQALLAISVPMNERPPKLNPPLVELIPIPPPGTVTGVSSGAAALVPIEWLREINTKGVRPGELAVLLDELEDQAEEDMVSACRTIPGSPTQSR